MIHHLNRDRINPTRTGCLTLSLDDARFSQMRNTVQAARASRPVFQFPLPEHPLPAETIAFKVFTPCEF